LPPANTTRKKRSLSRQQQPLIIIKKSWAAETLGPGGLLFSLERESLLYGAGEKRHEGSEGKNPIYLPRSR